MNKSAIKKILGFLIFISILCTLFCHLTWLLRGNSSEAREDIYGFRNQGSVDVVFYGASNLLRYYQPLVAWNEKGYTSYNYAVSSGAADSLKDFIADSRKSNEAILYVCDVRAITILTEEVDESALRNWSDSLPVFSVDRWRGITSFLFSRDWKAVDVLSFYLDIMKYHTNTDALKSECQWGYLNLESIYSIDKGFDPNKNHIPFEEPEAVNERGELTNHQEKALNELLDYCDDEGLQVLFICNPIIITEDDWRVLNTVGDRIKERGYNFINFNEYYYDMGLDFETDFGDVNHVNFLGAEKYTKYLMNYISSHYDLPDHRDNPVYNQWNVDYETFVTFQNKWREDIHLLVESHMQSKADGQELPAINNFTEWYAKIGNPDYSIIVRVEKMPEDLLLSNPFRKLAEDFEINLSKDSYIGVWKGERASISTSDELTVETGIGVDGGRGTERCYVSIAERALYIGEIDYYIEGSGIQILVYDNNFEKVIDNVLIDVGSDYVSIRR